MTVNFSFAKAPLILTLEKATLFDPKTKYDLKPHIYLSVIKKVIYFFNFKILNYFFSMKKT